jgi:hypothetical protein
MAAPAPAAERATVKAPDLVSDLDLVVDSAADRIAPEAASSLRDCFAKSKHSTQTKPVAAALRETFFSKSS